MKAIYLTFILIFTSDYSFADSLDGVGPNDENCAVKFTNNPIVEEDTIYHYDRAFGELRDKAHSCILNVDERYQKLKEKLEALIDSKNITTSSELKSEESKLSTCLNSIKNRNDLYTNSFKKNRVDMQILIIKFKNEFKNQSESYFRQISNISKQVNLTNDRTNLYRFINQANDLSKKVSRQVTTFEGQITSKKLELENHQYLISSDEGISNFCKGFKVGDFLIGVSFYIQSINRMNASLTEFIKEFNNSINELVKQVNLKIDQINNAQEIDLTSSTLADATHLRSANNLYHLMNNKIDRAFNVKFPSRLLGLEFISPKLEAVKEYQHFDEICTLAVPYSGIACKRSDKFRDKARKFDEQYIEYSINLGLSLLRSKKISEIDIQRIESRLRSFDYNGAVALYDSLLSKKGN